MAIRQGQRSLEEDTEEGKGTVKLGASFQGTPIVAGFEEANGTNPSWWAAMRGVSDSCRRDVEAGISPRRIETWPVHLDQWRRLRDR